MKKLATLLFLFISIAVFSQVNKKTLKFQKAYNNLEFKVKTKYDSVNYITTQKINKLSYDLKVAQNDLQSKYASNQLKMVLYQKKYERETAKLIQKYNLKVAELQSNHQTEIAKIQSKFQTETGKLMLEFKIN